MIMVRVAVPPGQSGQNGHAPARCAVGERLIAVTGSAMRQTRCMVAAGRVRTTAGTQAGTPAVAHPHADPATSASHTRTAPVLLDLFRYGHH